MQTLQARREQLTTALAEQWEYELRESPEFATMIGDYRYNDRWSDISLAHVDREKRDTAAWLARFRAIDTTGFPEQERLHQRLMVRKLEERLEDLEFKGYEMPVDQLDGVHILLPQLVNLMPFASAEHYEQYVSRLEAVPKLTGQAIELMRQGMRDGLVPPRYLLEKTIEQCRSIADPAGESNVFARPAAVMPEDMPEGEQERLRRQVLAAVDGRVRPAYSALADFIRQDYAPRGRLEEGVWSLPDGDAYYGFLIRHLTTTRMEPKAIHQLGLDEVARIERDQAAIARSLGYSELKTFRASLKGNRELTPISREHMLQLYRGFIEQMQAELPRLFGLLPKVGIEVRPVEEYREKEAAPAEYYPGTPDGSRAGIVYINTCDYDQRSTVGMESVAYHEAIPGHHLQISIAQALPDLPPFRRHGYFGAYTEGWALYAERLGKEIGFYRDPYSDFGRLSNELLRAVRLVVDTGVHHRRWTREQMVDYFREHSSEDEPDLQAEVDRYIVLPAQALSYKLGEISILGLRERAERELGAGYDIRAFHDVVLDGGALPLDVLEERIEEWIAAQGAASGVPAGPGPRAGDVRSHGNGGLGAPGRTH